MSFSSCSETIARTASTRRAYCPTTIRASSFVTPPRASRCQHGVRHIREALRIGSPGVDVDRPLTADKLRQELRPDVLDRIARHRDHPKLNPQSAVVVPLSTMREREEQQPFSVRRRMRKPVFAFVVRDALCLFVVDAGTICG